MIHRSRLALPLSCVLLTSALPQRGLSQTVSGLADREISRRYAKIEDAKTAIARGDNLFREAKYEEALSSYQGAVQTIPVAPYTAEWTQYAELKYADCAVVVAKERAKEGKYEEARLLLTEALAKFPEHKAAKILAAQLDDPDRWPQALTSAHVENVKKVEKTKPSVNTKMYFASIPTTAPRVVAWRMRSVSVAAISIPLMTSSVPAC
jgi:general secretion pathway protein D